ncbi:MAG TPA: hypothetical protein VNC78_10090 [Actinomycetota bacterium]|nr:hypothetical protein [Actinomycetota bacterium]
MKRAAAILSLVVMLLSASTSTSLAAPQREPGKKRASFVAQGSILAPGTTPITLMDWSRSCPELPATQGVSAYIFEMPESFLTSRSAAYVEGTAVGADFGYRLWFFDDACSASVCCSDAPAKVPRATKFIYVTQYFDGASEFELTVTR